MKYGIASYHRPECKTVETLLKCGVAASDIIISTQSLEDYKQYKEKHAVEVIYAEKDCAGGNRNTILDAVNEPVVLLDDDITNFVCYNGKSFKTSENVLLEAVEKMTRICKENNIKLAGISATTNSLCRVDRDDVSLRTLLQGSFLLFMDNGIRFDERWKMVEDYELSLKLIRRGQLVARFNDYCAVKPKNGTNSGGMHDRYERGELKLWIAQLGKVYPIFKPNKDMTGGRVKL